MDDVRMIILNNMVQQIAITGFRSKTPYRTGHLRYDATKLIPIMNYDAFNILVDGKVAKYGHILEVSPTIKYYYGKGSRKLPKDQRSYRRLTNRHYHWITEKAIPEAVERIAIAIGGKVIY